MTCVFRLESLWLSAMKREQLDAELMKGVESLKSGKTYTVDEIDAELKKEFGI